MSQPPLTGERRTAAAWFGKLPSAGDFVGRRMPHAMESEWDQWMRAGLDQLRHEGGANWQESFVQCPMWFFITPTQTRGGLAAGAIAPSIDRVGRYYPIVVMTLSSPDSPKLAGDGQIAQYFAEVRQAIVDARRVPLQPPELDDRLSTVCSPFEAQRHAPGNALIGDILTDLHIAEMQSSPQTVCLPPLEWRQIVGGDAGTSLWWVSPTAQFRQDLVVHHGPMHRPLFARLFKGNSI